ncbi:MAG TPA: hypothetical protein VMY39_01640 [Planctomycetota bacterium]|nr:hypothetical protein [Planctomycetota bacterium]
MSSGIRKSVRVPMVAALLVLCLAAWVPVSAAEPAPTGADDNLTTPSAGATATPDPADDDAKKDQARRDLARRVAALAIVLTLILVVFIVTVMITSRRLRARYLGWHRKIRFRKLWDVWWSKEKPKEKD